MAPPKPSATDIRSRKAAKRSSRDAKAASPSQQRAGPIPRPYTPPSKPYCPSFPVVFKFFMIVRCIAAVYSNISDCDEVFNYWEDSHYLQYGYGLQTWEYSPEYAIRSWAYAGLHALAGAVFGMFADNKRSSFLVVIDIKRIYRQITILAQMQVFYLIRMTLGILSAYCEARFYRAVVDEVNPHVGRYVLVALLFSAGMFNASTAYLPSTFAMFMTFLAFTHVLRTPSNHSRARTYGAVLHFALGALLGWPFSAALGIPFAIEELLVHGPEGVVRQDGGVETVKASGWRVRRAIRLVEAAVVCFVVVLGPIVVIDWWFYRRVVVVPANIVAYNVFGGSERGPDIYGTEPWWFYAMNGLLNFNVLFVLAVASGACLFITSIIDRDRLGSSTPPGTSSHVSTSPFLVMSLKLSPLYLWLIIFTLQPHKEERFLFVAYPVICLNAGIALFLIKGWTNRLGALLGVHPQLRQQLLSLLVAAVLLTSTVVSISRVIALGRHYRAPLGLFTALWIEPLKGRFANLTNGLKMEEEMVNFCVGKEWYRFPSSYFLPKGVRLRFVESEFKGLLPGEFVEDFTVIGGEEGVMPKRVDPSTCTYLVDSDFPHRYVDAAYAPPPREPRYALDADTWERLACRPFLDAENSNRWSRAFWVPGARGKVWGEYCLLGRKAKEGMAKGQIENVGGETVNETVGRQEEIGEEKVKAATVEVDGEEVVEKKETPRVVVEDV
ncbi:Alg9-like mannosyltransferase family-domain-containing protein [Jimgerdemannia flammicorona]|uniref:Mannosyltransferase n=1 Tax=Jimgerdemannia flammicorona TaxID=994334 RepID=A0A433QWW2_9FUNG|nr:Alg9-like mannosyltransferase family-domain-containing protein [Jimgerdemannia flammicorona]